MLDLQVSLPIIYPQNATLYYGSFQEFCGTIDPSVDPSAQADPYCDHKGRCAKYKATNVISISYSEEEDKSDLEQRRQCLEFMKLGIQGVSVLVPSGDNGVGGYTGDAFQAAFPSSCPYVTSVGGTMVSHYALPFVY